MRTGAVNLIVWGICADPVGVAAPAGFFYVAFWKILCYAICGQPNGGPVLLDMWLALLTEGSFLPSNLTKGGLPNGYIF